MLGEALPPAPIGSSLREIQERGWLIVGITQDVPVFGYLNSSTGGLEGLEVELASHIARTILGDARKVEYRAADFSDPDLDIILSRIPVTAHLERYTLSDVYFVSDQVLLIPAGGSVQRIQDLAGRSVAIVEGSAVAEMLSVQVPEATLVSFNTYVAALQSLEDGQVAALAGDAVVLRWLADQEPGRWQVTEPFAHQAYAVAVPKGQPALLDAVNRAIKSFESFR